MNALAKLWVSSEAIDAAMPLTPVTPLKAQGLLGDGARLIDIRSPHEFDEAHVPGSDNQPLGSGAGFDEGEAVVFLCRTGKRTQMNEGELASLCQARAYLIDGGLEAWREAGLPVSAEAERPSGFEGGTLTFGGGLIFVGLLFGWLRTSWWLIIPALVAIDMILAGFGRGSVLVRITSWLGSRVRKMRQGP